MLYRKAIFLEYVLLYSTHKIPKGYPYLVSISEISKMAALISHRIPKVPNRVSKISKISKSPKMSENIL